MQITPVNPVNINTQAESLWVSSITIFSPTPTSPISIRAKIQPMNSGTMQTFPELGKDLVVDDLVSVFETYPSAAIAMNAVEQAVQDMVTGMSLF